MVKLRARVRRPSASMVVALLALVVAASGAAFAAIPDSAGEIHGCYNDRGLLRVIDTESGATCNPSNETEISWNQEGPQGLQGIQGTPGPAYSAGSGLDLAGTTFSIPSEGVDSDKIKNNTIKTEDLAAGAALPGIARTGRANTTISSEDGRRALNGLFLQPGGYFLIAKGTVHGPGSATGLSRVDCELRAVNLDLELDSTSATASPGGASAFVLDSWLKLSATDEVQLACTTPDSDVGLQLTRLTAIEVRVPF